MRSRELNRAGDTGAAMAMVIIFVIVMGLWLSAAAALAQNTDQLIQRNSVLGATRSELVSRAMDEMLAHLTDVSNGIRKGIGRNQDPLGLNTCQEDPVFVSTDGIQVFCSEATESGEQSPLASFVLTGDGSSCASSPCVTGYDGGLQLSLSSTPCYHQDSNSGAVAADMLQKLTVTGGVFNLSGRWRGVSCNTLALAKAPATAEDPAPRSPKFTQAFTCTPYGTWDMTCPDWAASPYSLNSSTGASGFYSDVPRLAVNNSAATNPNPIATDVFADIDASDATTYVGGYLRGIAADLSNLDTVAGTQTLVAANIPTSCSALPAGSEKALESDGTTVSSVDVYYRLLDIGSITGGKIGVVSSSAVLANLNSLISSCGEGDTAGSPALKLRGVLRMALAAAGTAKPASCGSTAVWCISSAVLVYSGRPEIKTVNGSNFVIACAVNKTNPTDGAQLQFSGGSYWWVRSGRVAVCPRAGETVAVAAPKTGYGTSWSWSGGSGAADWFLENDNGSAGSVKTSLFTGGLFYAPGGSAWSKINGWTYVSFARGAVLKGLYINGTGSVQGGGSVAPPKPSNGDRLVQLRFYDPRPTGNIEPRDLGLVQIRIRDVFGLQPAKGYSVITWRTMW